jgi:predicted amidohydrolase
MRRHPIAMHEGETNRQVRAAAIQLATKIADSAANIAGCERLAQEAVQQGARWIALPEFFTTGVAWDPRIVDAIETEGGPAATFLRDFSARHHIVIGGSFLCRISGGAVRNSYMAFANGTLIGRHDKDLPTMWENAFYEGGDPGDTGILGEYEGVRVGAAVCWEYMRTMTAQRLRNRVDVIMGGSCWWSIPTYLPGWIKDPWETQNALNALACVQDTARLVGTPVIHAAHCGHIDCPMFGLPLLPYWGYFEGNAAIVDATGKVIARRTHEEGQGIVYAEVSLGAVPVHEKIPERFWLRSRGLLPTIAWHYQRLIGRRWYRRHVVGSQTHT